ncbi:MAG: PKD domain-containing protein [Thermoplasmata archaeon]|nr:PKD domain-containing protein [Thermoplasmata archaeon]
MRILTSGHTDGPARAQAPFALPQAARVRAARYGVPALVALVAVGALLIPLFHAGASPRPVSAPSHAEAGLQLSSTPAGAPPAKPGAWLKLGAQALSAPAPGTGAAMAYDPQTSSVILFGGCSSLTCPSSETWSFTHGNWTNLTSSLATAPSPRSGATLSYDPSEKALVLFGGRTSTGVSAETWQFRGTYWAMLSPTGGSPSPRTDARSTYDPTVGGILLLGGALQNGQALSDLWMFASGRWSNVTDPTAQFPPARSAEAFVYDASDGFDLLFGGNGACGHPCGDTWSYAHQTWTNRTSSTASGPAARDSAGVVYDPLNNGLLLFGGHGTAAMRDSWTYASSQWTNLSALGVHAVPGRSSATVAYDAADGYIIALGTQSTGSPVAATWAFVLPLQASLLLSGTVVVPGQAVQLTAFVVGGLPPYRYALATGVGNSVSTSPRLVYSYASPGAYRATLNVTDSRGVYALDQGIVRVADLPLALALGVTPGTVQPGSTATFTAQVTGGRAPYLLVWSGLPVNCPSSSTSSLTCAPRLAGDYRVTVTVTDARNATEVASVGLTVPAPQPAGSATLPTTSAAAPAVMPIGWVLVPPIGAGLILSTLGALMMWKAARRLPPPPAPRPFCYIPPEWSETPDDTLRSR